MCHDRIHVNNGQGQRQQRKPAKHQEIEIRDEAENRGTRRLQRGIMFVRRD